jgi:hypothetical protein
MSHQVQEKHNLRSEISTFEGARATAKMQAVFGDLLRVFFSTSVERDAIAQATTVEPRMACAKKHPQQIPENVAVQFGACDDWGFSDIN